MLKLERIKQIIISNMERICTKMKKLQCVIHSPSPNTSLIQKVITKKLSKETSNLIISVKSPFDTNAEDILNSDGVLIGTTENLSSMAGATKDFFDRTYYGLLDKKEGLPTAIWIRAGHDGTGTLRQFNSIIQGLKWKLIQEILVCKGDWNEEYIDQCTELSLGLAIGLEANIY